MISAGPTAGARIPHAAADGAVFIIDPGRRATWLGSGQFAYNLVRNPDDGALQTDYDFVFGTSPTVEATPDVVSDPIVVGAPGNRGNYFASANVANLPWALRLAADNTPFLRNMHKTGSKFTIEMWVQIDGPLPTGFAQVPLFDTGTSDHSGNSSARGLMYCDTASNYFLSSEHGLMLPFDEEWSGQYNVHRLVKSADAQIEHGVPHMLAVSCDTTGAAQSFFYKDGAYDPSDGVDTWSGIPAYQSAYETENRAVINGRWQVERPDLDNNAAVRTKLFYMRVYNRNLSKAELDANWASLRYRWGI